MNPDLVCTLAQVERAAAQQWAHLNGREEFVARELARATGLAAVTIGKYRDNRAQQIDFTSLGLFAWYFDVAVDDLFRLMSELELSGTKPDTETIPRLRRTVPPAGIPGQGAVCVINRIPTVLTRWTVDELADLTGWQPSFISRLSSGGQRRIAYATIAKLLTLIGETKVSTLIDVERTIPSWITGTTNDTVAIAEQRPTWLVTDWNQVVQTWRELAGDQPRPGKLAVVDVASIRWLSSTLKGQRPAGTPGRESRLGSQWATACGVSRQLIGGVVRGSARPGITAADCPAEVIAKVRPLVEGLTTTIINPSPVRIEPDPGSVSVKGGRDERMGEL